jgi:hypothetical protein
MMNMAITHARNADAKGRVTLGERFANQTVLVEDRGDDLLIRLARVIPAREAWLYENNKARAMVRRGLSQAKAGHTAPPPNLAAAKRMVAKLPRDTGRDG